MKLKRFFQTRSRREQWLITVFLLGLAAVWLADSLGRAGAAWREWRSVGAAADTQELWLGRQAQIEAAAAAAAGNLDPARTYDATRLVGAVNTLATGAGFRPQIDPAQTRRTPQFAYHTIKVTVRRASLAALLGFYDELAKQAPYLSLEQISVQAERGSQGQLTATLQISAPQIVK